MAIHTLRRALHFLNSTCSVPYNSNSLYVNNNQLSIRMSKQCINISCNVDYCKIADFDDTTTRKKKKIFVPRVTLLSENNDMSIVTLEEAEKIARRQNLKLIKIVDLNTKSEREVFQLMKIRDYIEADAKIKATVRQTKDKTIKDEKIITMSSKISEHDLNTKIKSIHNMLRKRHGVRAVISMDGGKDRANEVANCIMEKSKHAAKVTINTGGHTLKIVLRPIIDVPNNQETGDSDSSMDNNK